jgi:hypothetical protein
MRLVVKIAGALLENDETVQVIARQIAEVARAGHEVLVVHGGGKIFTATLARMGISSRFVNGLRVTDRETRDAAIMVFAGLLNKKVAGGDFAGGSAGGGCERKRRDVPVGGADAGGRARRRAWLRRVPDGSECGILPFVVARWIGSSDFVHGTGGGR